jgi:hypothetical protein
VTPDARANLDPMSRATSCRNGIAALFARAVIA